MSAGEVAFRVRERVANTVERAAFQRGWLCRADRLRAALCPDLRRRPDWSAALLDARGRTDRFYPSLRSAERLRKVLPSSFPAETAKARLAAREVREHRFHFFGQCFEYGARIDWHGDPVSGREWPRRYHGDIPIHAGDVGFGDVKYVWELSRHQFLIDLAKAFVLFETGDDAAEVKALVRSWMEDNPYGLGVNWACALEPAFRVQSWLWAYHMCLADVRADPEMHLLWLTGFGDHGRFLYRHLERYSSPFNHLVGEAAALYALGVVFPEFKEAAAWRRRGRDVLESTVSRQFYEDGGSVEQSTFYHHATLGSYILAAVLGRVNGEEFSAQTWGAIERGLEYSMWLAQPDGRTPSIGGADDGKPIRLEQLPFWDFRPYLAVGAVLFDRPDFKYAAGRFTEDAFWLLGAEGLDTFERLPAEPPKDISKALRRSGYFVLRSDWTASADYVCFDCGEQAASARRDEVPSAVHGHADCLSMIVCLGGQPVLVDPGFYCYNGDPVWEAHFRKTCAHNTARVDRRDQAQHQGKMDWCQTYAAHPEQWQMHGRQLFVTGSHDGYARAPLGVTHRRTVWLRPTGYLLILDEFEGDGKHDLELTFQFAPGYARLDQGSVMFQDRFELAWCAPAGISARLDCGDDLPDGGWVAPSLGVKVPAPRLNLHLAFTPPRTAVLSVLADCRVTHGQRRIAVGEVSRPLAPSIITIAGPGFVDWIAPVPEGEDVTICETDARLALWRVEGESVTEQSRIGGSFLRVRPGAGVLEAATR